MSELADKLKAQVRTTFGPAMATRAQLLGRSRLVQDKGDEVWLHSMGRVELWRRVSGSGASAVFQMVSTEPQQEVGQ